MTVTLETERLILRPPLPEDLDSWAAFHGDAQSMRYLGGALSRAEAWRGMAVVAGSWALRGFGYFSLIEKASGHWVGRSGPWYPEGWPEKEIGWMIAAEARGKGYASEAARASLDFVFGTLGWARVVHIIDPENLASHGVARKIGSRLLGPVTLPPPLSHWPVEAWGQSREDWRA